MRTVARVIAVDYHLPKNPVTNADLAKVSSEWIEDDIFQKTGIRQRMVVGEGEFASDLVICAAKKLFERGCCQPGDVDFLIYVTQSPDQLIPATSCILQHKLGLPQHCGAIDINQGCSGYVYGLGVATGLIESHQARGVLLLCGDTLSRYVGEDDMTVRTIFGDAGTATWITASDDTSAAIGPFLHGTDGSGAPNICVTGGALQSPSSADGRAPRIFMNGPEVFAFTMSAVPKAVKAFLEKAQLTAEEIDLFVFHQANAFILERLRSKLKIPPERFVSALENCGNTTSSSIPVSLRIAENDSRLKSGMRVLVAGYGVGYSWSLGLFRWP